MSAHDHDPSATSDRSAVTSLTLVEAWPIFGLRVRSERLELRLPTDDELVALMEVARAGIHPPDEMPFGFAWTDKPDPRFERDFLQYHWKARADWTADAWSLELGVFLAERMIGSQTVRGERFAVFRTVDTGSWLGQAFQGMGYGTEMRSAVLALAFDGLAARFATSGAFFDNARSTRVSRALGYEADGIREFAPRGEPRPTQRWRMSEEIWRSRERPPVTIEGLDPIRDLFGA